MYGPPRPVSGITLHFYIDGVCTSQETHLWASTVYYGDSFTFYMQMMFVPHRKHVYGPPRSLTVITSLFL
jgi:hypothetical protein